MSMPNSFRLAGTPSTNVMSDAQRAALDRLASNVFRRGRRGWEAKSCPDIAFHTAAMLKQQNLATIATGNGRDRLAITQLGREAVDLVRTARRKRTDQTARYSAEEVGS